MMEAVEKPSMTPAEASGKQIDREQALSRVGGDADLLKEIAGMFLEESPIMLGTMESAMVKADAETLERSAHTFKGSVANFGATQAFDAALALEMIGRRKDLSSAPEALARVREAFEKLRPELEALAAE